MHCRSQGKLESVFPNSQDIRFENPELLGVGVLHHDVESILKTIGEPSNSIEIPPPSTVLCQKPNHSDIQLAATQDLDGDFWLLAQHSTNLQQP